MRFYQVEAPWLAAELAGNNLLVSRLVTMTGHALESAESLTDPQWEPLSQTPGIEWFWMRATNTVTDGSLFYRLKKRGQ